MRQHLGQLQKLRRAVLKITVAVTTVAIIIWSNQGRLQICRLLAEAALRIAHS
jgi:hypothetical protein